MTCRIKKLGNTMTLISYVNPVSAFILLSLHSNKMVTNQLNDLSKLNIGCVLTITYKRFKCSI